MNQADIVTALKAVIASLRTLIAKRSFMPISIYNVAAGCLGKHITLDNTVPPDLGCAEAVSYVLKNAGLPVPVGGFPGTAGLYSWLTNTSLFTQTRSPSPGDIVISPSGMSTKGDPHGHTGIVAKYGILSNNSDSGLFMEVYSIDTWDKYFGDTLGFPVYYFRAL